MALIMDCPRIFLPHIFLHYTIFINASWFRRCSLNRMVISKDFPFKTLSFIHLSVPRPILWTQLHKPIQKKLRQLSQGQSGQ